MFSPGCPSFPIIVVLFSSKLSSALLDLKMHFVTKRITMSVQTVFSSVFRSARNREPKMVQITT